MDPISRAILSSGGAGDPPVVLPDVEDVFASKSGVTGTLAYDAFEFDTGLDIGLVMPDEKAYVNPGQYTFTVPSGVTSINIVCIGAGGGGIGYGPGGGGGALCYKNGLGVSAGDTFTVKVGAAGRATGYGGQYTGYYPSSDGGDSSITQTSGGNFTMTAGGGQASSSEGNNNNYSGGNGGSAGSPSGGYDGGYNGGRGGNAVARGSGNWNSGGGGGAAGYSGNGGAGGDMSSQTSGSGGSSGSGGGGGGGSAGWDTTNTGYAQGGEGGGVGMFKKGSSGAGGSSTNAGVTTTPKVGIGGEGGSKYNYSWPGAITGTKTIALHSSDGGDEFAWDEAGDAGGGGSNGYVGGADGAVRIVFDNYDTRYFNSGSSEPTSITYEKYFYWMMPTVTETSLQTLFSTNVYDERFPWRGYSNSLSTGVWRWRHNRVFNGHIGFSRMKMTHTSGSYEQGVCSCFAFKPTANFCDVVNWSGNGTSPRTISHSLGEKPGFILIVSQGSSGSGGASGEFLAFHSDGSTDKCLHFSNSSANTGKDKGQITGATSTGFTVDSGTANHLAVNDPSYVYSAFLLANNALVKCGSYTGNSSTQNITTGQANGPQFIMIKDVTDNISEHWQFSTIKETTNGDTYLGQTTGVQNTLREFTGGVSNASTYFRQHTNGFQLGPQSSINNSGRNYVYIAIQAP